MTSKQQNKSNEKPSTKKLIVIRGKGTAKEQRIETNITLYYSKYLQRWVTVPQE